MGFKTLFCSSFACLLYTVFFVFYNVASEMNFEMCTDLNDRFRVFYRVDIDSCKYECGRRPGCFHLRYQLSRKECGLYGIVNNETEVFGFESLDELDLPVNNTCVIIGSSHIDMAKCKCKVGMACQANGTCQYEECPPVPQLNSTRGVVKGNVQNIGAKVKVQCNDGCTRIPDKQTVCGNDGQWGVFPECLRCPSVPQMDPTRGVIDGSMQNIGATVRVQCNAGYTRVPDIETIVCGNDGKWGVFPECLRCPSVPQMDPTRGVIDGSMQNIGATVRVQCNAGYTRVPDIETIVCRNNGHWGVFPDCIWNCYEPCPRLPYTSNVTAGGTLEGDTRNYTCQDGLYVNDTSQSQNITIVCKRYWWDYGDISSQLCVNDEIYPNKPENAVRMINCMILEFNVDYKTYDESREQCSRYGDLVRVDTDEKQFILKSYMSINHYGDANCYWLQGKRIGAEWVFSDGTQIVPYWASGQPNQNYNCFIIWEIDGWMWNDIDCSVSYRFICEYTEI